MQDPMETNRGKSSRKINWLHVFLFFSIFLFTTTILTLAALYAYCTYKGVPALSCLIMPSTFDRNTNILLLGVDEGDPNYPDAPKRSDTMILAGVNPQAGTVTMLSIPRDTQVNIPGQDGYDKINHAYALGGPDLAERTVANFLNVPIDYYAVMNWQGFIKVIDILGGVDLDVKDDMDYDDPYQNLSIHVKKGYQHLDGEKAGEYVRFRHDELGDIGRVERQQIFLKALNDQLFSLGTIVKLPALIEAISQNVTTNMPPETLVELANTIRSFKNGGLRTEMLPGDFATIDGLSYWAPDMDQIKQMMANTFPVVQSQ